MVQRRAAVGLKDQAGFSMVEMLIALALFVTSIIGIGAMLIQGTVGVNGSAVRNKATRYASEKIEEVKSIAFYMPWSGTAKDIDDMYWNPGYDNANQTAHPIEENPIAGAAGYRRSVSVHYVYVKDVAGVKSLDTATMYNQADGRWVTTYPDDGGSPPTFDEPTGGATNAANTKLHGLMIEVRVYFYENGVQQSVVQHAIVGDLLTPGGSTGMDPILVVTGISPNESYCGVGYGDVVLDISVNAPQMLATDTVNVELWQSNTSQKITGTGVTIINIGEASPLIRAHFNFTTVPSIGVYNLAVNWVTRGFIDNNYRNCFTVKSPPIVITNVYTINDQAGNGPNGHAAWGYNGMGARRVWVTGQNIYWQASLNLVLEKAGQSSLPGSGMTCAGDGTWAYADFNLSTAASGDWDFSCDSGTAGKTTRATCLEVNPIASVYSIDMTGGKYSWGFRDDGGTRPIRVNGTGLYGSVTGFMRRVGCSDCPAACSSSASGNNIRWSDCNYADFNVTITGTAANRPNVSDWAVYATNHSGSQASVSGAWDGVNPDYSFRINPAPAISGVGGWPGNANSGTGEGGGNAGRTLGGISVSGSYLQSSMSMYIVRTVGGSPVSGQDTYCDLTGASYGSASSITNMTMGVAVNPMTAGSFKTWGSGTVQSDNSKIGGTYYIYYVGRDGQACLSPSVWLDHHAYTISSSVSPANWGTVSGTGGYWQDTSWSVSPNPVSSAGNYMGSLRVWQEPPGSDQWGYPWTLTGTAVANRSFNCRFAKWFYHGDDLGSPNKAGFVGYQLAQHTWYKATQAENGYYVFYVRSSADSHIFSGAHEGRLGARTTNWVDYTGASTLYWYGMNDSGSGNGADNWCAVCSSGGADGAFTGQMWINGDDTFGYAWRTCNVWGRGSGYLHFNSECDYSILGGNNTNFRIRYVFME